MLQLVDIDFQPTIELEKENPEKSRKKSCKLDWLKVWTVRGGATILGYPKWANFSDFFVRFFFSEKISTRFLGHVYKILNILVSFS